MPKTDFTQYDKDPANNTDIDGVDIAEGCAPSGINNAIRSVMSHIAEMNDGTVPLASPDINGGTLDGVTIGGTTAGAGTFTTFTSNGIDDNATSTAVTLDSSGNVGIGTSSPAYLIDAQTSSGNAQLGITSGGDLAQIILTSTDTVGTSQINFADADSSNVGMLQYFHGDNHMEFTVNSSERMRIDSSGNVGIGTSSPTHQLATGNKVLHLDSGANQGSEIKLEGASGLLSVGNTGAAAYFYNVSNTPVIFGTNNSERMRLDSSGNLLVGKTSTSNATTTVGFHVQPSGVAVLTRDGGAPLRVSRKTSDGEIMSFHKDGTTVGSIGSSAGNFFIEKASNSGLQFGSSGQIAPRNSGAISDNTVDLGSVTYRFDDIYATNGTIQTSDANEKQQIASLTDAEMTAAKAISKLFKTFKWNDKVEAKGDAARRHTGVIAQDVQQAMTNAGLDAGDYAFFISTTWWETQTEVPAVEADEENGVEAQDAYTRTDTYDTAEEAPEGATERTRLGIRYPELLAFVGAATEQRLASIESRLDTLESA